MCLYDTRDVLSGIKSIKERTFIELYKISYDHISFIEFIFDGFIYDPISVYETLYHFYLLMHSVFELEYYIYIYMLSLFNIDMMPGIRTFTEFYRIHRII